MKITSVWKLLFLGTKRAVLSDKSRNNVNEKKHVEVDFAHFSPFVCWQPLNTLAGLDWCLPGWYTLWCVVTLLFQMCHQHIINSHWNLNTATNLDWSLPAATNVLHCNPLWSQSNRKRMPITQYKWNTREPGEFPVIADDGKCRGAHLLLLAPNCVLIVTIFCYTEMWQMRVQVLRCLLNP